MPYHFHVKKQKLYPHPVEFNRRPHYRVWLSPCWFFLFLQQTSWRWVSWVCLRTWEFTVKDLFSTSLWYLTPTWFRLCLTIAEFVLRAVAGVWLRLPPAGDWDRSLCGEVAGDFFFLASFFLQAAVLWELVFWQKEHASAYFSTVQVFDLWPFAPQEKHFMKPSVFFFFFSCLVCPPPVPFTCFLFSVVITFSLYSSEARFMSSLYDVLMLGSPVAVFRLTTFFLKSGPWSLISLWQQFVEIYFVQICSHGLELQFYHVGVQGFCPSSRGVEELLSSDEERDWLLELGAQLEDHGLMGVLVLKLLFSLHPHIWIDNILEEVLLHACFQGGMVSNLKPI